MAKRSICVKRREQLKGTGSLGLKKKGGAPTLHPHHVTHITQNSTAPKWLPSTGAEGIALILV